MRIYGKYPTLEAAKLAVSNFAIPHVSPRGYVVYRFTHNASGKVYIGITRNLQRRLVEHLSPDSGCIRFVSLIQLDGLDAFTLDVLCDGVSVELAAMREREAIALVPAELRLNMTAGGEHPFIPKVRRSPTASTARHKGANKPRKKKAARKAKTRFPKVAWKSGEPRSRR